MVSFLLVSGLPALSTRDGTASSHSQLSVALDQPIATVDSRFLSVAVDVAHVVGGEFWDPARERAIMGTDKTSAFDFERPALRNLARHLAPGYLRIGGTDADKTVYEFGASTRDNSTRDSNTHDNSPPVGQVSPDWPADDTRRRGRPTTQPKASNHPAAWVLKQSQWDAANAFADDLDFRIVFTLNAGLSARGKDGRWNSANARGLIRYSAEKGYPVDVWEFGNELNVFPLLHGHFLSRDGYTRDIRAVRALLDELAPEAQLAGPAVAFWPLFGEGLPFLDRFLPTGGHLLDVVTWHYYPEQSARCPVSTNPARAGEVLDARGLSEIEKWAEYVEVRGQKHSPKAQVWLGETGSAQCGGQPGLSDTIGSSFWWLDQLGRMARRGQRVVVRQTLSGGTYALIDNATLTPNPDYWASVLWQRLMGTRVLAARASPEISAYAHCGAQQGLANNNPGAVTAVVLNTDASVTRTVQTEGWGDKVQLYVVSPAGGQGARAKQVVLNGVTLEASPDGQLPDLTPVTLSGRAARTFSLPPLSYAFAVYPQAQAPACTAGVSAYRPG